MPNTGVLVRPWSERGRQELLSTSFRLQGGRRALVPPLVTKGLAGAVDEDGKDGVVLSTALSCHTPRRADIDCSPAPRTFEDYTHNKDAFHAR